MAKASSIIAVIINNNNVYQSQVPKPIKFFYFF
jgi:hypothetical protein